MRSTGVFEVLIVGRNITNCGCLIEMSAVHWMAEKTPEMVVCGSFEMEIL